MKKNSRFIFFRFFWNSPLQLLLCKPGGKSGLGDKAGCSEEETRQEVGERNTPICAPHDVPTRCPRPPASEMRLEVLEG